LQLNYNIVKVIYYTKIGYVSVKNL
jgi:hypothetical protein